MLVLSWNVASLPKVMSCIERHFGFKTFDQYISDHLKADILCLQETKVNESSLSDRGIASRLGLLSSKYDAFSCPVRIILHLYNGMKLFHSFEPTSRSVSYE